MDSIFDIKDDLPFDPAKPLADATPAPTYKEAVERHTCQKCGGTGVFVFGYVHRRAGKCHACRGVGYFKTSPAQRTAAKAARVRAQIAQEREGRAGMRDWLEAHPRLAATLARGLAREWEFAISLKQSLEKYGSLTERQIAALERAAERDEAYDAAKAAKEQRPAADISGAGFARLYAGFMHAKQRGLIRLALEIGRYRFSLASDTSRNPRWIYIKAADGTYLGKVSPEGKLFAGRDMTDEDKVALAEIGRDPLAAAVVHGKETGRCSCCGRTLTNQESIEMGIGPICRQKWGW